MKNNWKKLLSIVLVLATFLPILCTTFSVEAEEKPEMGSIEEIIASYYDSNGRPMSCAHRAISYNGNQTPENSLLAIKECIEAKVDIVELDIMRTSDGVYVLCHDSSIKRTTTYTGSKTVAQMTYAEICQYPLLKGVGNSDVYYDENGKTMVMPTFEEALKLCKDHLMINLDKFTGQWNYRMELYELVKNNGCLDNVMFKGGYDSAKVKGWHDEIKAKYGNDAKMPNFCTLNSNRNADAFVSEIKAHYDNKTAFAVEAGFSEYGQPQTDPAVMAQIRQYARPFANVLYESIGGTHSAKHKENATGWAAVIAIGFNILQTNNSADLAAYIYENYSGTPKDISKGVNPIRFVDYKRDTINTTVAVSSLGVRLSEGDWIVLSDVDFSQNAGKYIMTAVQNDSATGTLLISKDDPSGEVIASYDLSKAGTGVHSLAEELTFKSDTPCKVCISVSGLESGKSVLVSNVASPKNGYGNAVNVVGATVFTTPGKAPELPKNVKVMTDLGYMYSTDVSWGPVPEGCYAETLSYFKVPGVIKETGETVFAEVTVLDVDMSALEIYFASDAGLVLEDGRVSKWIDSASGIVATASGSTMPTVGKVSEGGRNAVTFDGIDDFMTYSHNIDGYENMTVITSSYTEKTTTDYLSSYAINNGARYTLLQYPESGSWGSMWLTTFKNAIVCRFGSGTDGNRGMYYTNVKADKWCVTAATKDKSNEYLYLNGELVYDRSNDKGKNYCAGEAGEKIANTHAYAYIGYGIQSSKNYYYNGSVSDIMIFKNTLPAEDVAKVNSYLVAKTEGGLKDFSQIVLDAYEQFLENEKENDKEEKVPDSLKVPSSPVDEKGSDIIVIVVVVTAVCVVAAFAVAVVLIKKKKH